MRGTDSNAIGEVPGWGTWCFSLLPLSVAFVAAGAEAQRMKKRSKLPSTHKRREQKKKKCWRGRLEVFLSENKEERRSSKPRLRGLKRKTERKEDSKKKQVRSRAREAENERKRKGLLSMGGAKEETRSKKKRGKTSLSSSLFSSILTATCSRVGMAPEVCSRGCGSVRPKFRELVVEKRLPHVPIGLPLHRWTYKFPCIDASRAFVYG